METRRSSSSPESEALRYAISGQGHSRPIGKHVFNMTGDEGWELIKAARHCRQCRHLQPCEDHEHVPAIRMLLQEVEECHDGPRHVKFIDFPAIRTLPFELSFCSSSMPGVGIGVCARTNRIPAERWWGPYKGRHISIPEGNQVTNSEYLWEIFEGKKVVYYVDGSDITAANWMRFIRCTWPAERANVFAVQHGQEIHYQTVREIKPNEELIVWYAPDCYESVHGVPIGLRSWHRGERDRRASRDTLRPPPGPINIPRTATTPIMEQHAQQHQQQGAYYTHATPGSHHGHSGSHSSMVHLPAPPPPGSAGPQVLFVPQQQQHHQQQPPPQPQQEKMSPAVIMPPGTLPGNYHFLPASPHGTGPPHGFAVALQPPDGMPLRFPMPPMGRPMEPPKQRHIHRWECSQCAEIFGQRLNMEKHVCRCGEIAKPYRCMMCTRTFTNGQYLQGHVSNECPRANEGPQEKPYGCDYCSKAFTGTTTLMNHIRTHYEDRPKRCDMCGEEFKSHTQMNRHMCRAEPNAGQRVLPVSVESSDDASKRSPSENAWHRNHSHSNSHSHGHNQHDDSQEEGGSDSPMINDLDMGSPGADGGAGAPFHNDVGHGHAMGSHSHSHSRSRSHSQYSEHSGPSGPPPETISYNPSRPLTLLDHPVASHEVHQARDTASSEDSASDSSSQSSEVSSSGSEARGDES